MIVEDNNNWSKCLVLVMRKLGIMEILITQADMDSVQAIEEAQRPCAVVFQMDDGVHIKLATQETVKDWERDPKLDS